MVASLHIHGNQYTLENDKNVSDPVDKAINKFEFHPSILFIKNRIGKSLSQFCFNEVTNAGVLNELILSTIKRCSFQYNTIWNLKTFIRIFWWYLKSLKIPRKFPPDLKIGDIVTIYKKKNLKPKKCCQ